MRVHNSTEKLQIPEDFETKFGITFVAGGIGCFNTVQAKDFQRLALPVENPKNSRMALLF
jgi:hypothetical protein